MAYTRRRHRASLFDPGLLLLATVAFVPRSVSAVGFGSIPGEYCSKRTPTCCLNRDDDCTASILDDHLCYCDIFCDRGPESNDCCPDFKATCQGIVPQPIGQGCMHDGIELSEGARVRRNCQQCTCSEGRWQCDEQGCLIQEDILESVSHGRFTWTARNYSKFWGRTLDDGIRYRLGTLLPERSVANMNEILIKPRELPERFDAREKWPLLIHGIRDQGDCAASWSFSTTATAADRLAIVTEGQANASLSAQQLLSCNQHRQKGCEGGYLDRAWWYIRKLGYGHVLGKFIVGSSPKECFVVSDDCYSYTSGHTQEPGDCRLPRQQYLSGRPVTCPNASTTDSTIFKTTPPYRVSKREEDIMSEIITNGPVQATFLVHEDFFIYSGGVYKHTELARNKGPQYIAQGYHSVRLLGWGEDEATGRPVKYWLAANSWGRDWGEDGHFRILRGENHCDIESFVIGAWGKDSKRRRRFKVRKTRRRYRNF